MGQNHDHGRLPQLWRGGGGREGRRREGGEERGGGGWQVSLHQLQVRNQTNLNVVCTDKAYINTTNRS